MRDSLYKQAQQNYCALDETLNSRLLTPSITTSGQSRDQYPYFNMNSTLNKIQSANSC